MPEHPRTSGKILLVEVGEVCCVDGKVAEELGIAVHRRTRFFKERFNSLTLSCGCAGTGRMA